MTTNDIDAAVHESIIARGAYPSPLGYSCFPRSCTTSVNNVIARELLCHPSAARIPTHIRRRYTGRVSTLYHAFRGRPRTHSATVGHYILRT